MYHPLLALPFSDLQGKIKAAGRGTTRPRARDLTIRLSLSSLCTGWLFPLRSLRSTANRPRIRSFKKTDSSSIQRITESLKFTAYFDSPLFSTYFPRIFNVLSSYFHRIFIVVVIFRNYLDLLNQLLFVEFVKIPPSPRRRPLTTKSYNF
jgi:hypothetical protein